MPDNYKKVNIDLSAKKLEKSGYKILDTDGKEYNPYKELMPASYQLNFEFDNIRETDCDDMRHRADYDEILRKADCKEDVKKMWKNV